MLKQGCPLKGTKPFGPFVFPREILVEPNVFHSPVDEWTDRLAGFPMLRNNLPVIGRTKFLGQQMVIRKFNVILPTEGHRRLAEGDALPLPWAGVAGLRSSTV